MCEEEEKKGIIEAYSNVDLSTYNIDNDSYNQWTIPPEDESNDIIRAYSHINPYDYHQWTTSIEKNPHDIADVYRGIKPFEDIIKSYRSGVILNRRADRPYNSEIRHLADYYRNLSVNTDSLWGIESLSYGDLFLFLIGVVLNLESWAFIKHIPDTEWYILLGITSAITILLMIYSYYKDKKMLKMVIPYFFCIWGIGAFTIEQLTDLTGFWLLIIPFLDILALALAFIASVIIAVFVAKTPIVIYYLKRVFGFYSLDEVSRPEWDPTSPRFKIS